MKKFKSSVTGVTYDNDNGVSRQKLIKAHCRKGDTLFLVPEPDNAYDSSAMAIYVQSGFIFKSKHKIGYLKSNVSASLIDDLSDGVISKVTAVVIEVTGGTLNKPNYGVNIGLDVS